MEMARGLRMDVALDRVAQGLETRDRAFLNELVFGVARLQGRLDHLISLRVHGGMARLDPEVLEVLRLGAYQLLYMGGVPRYAAVSQTVSQAKWVAGKGAGGLTNAVLRGVADAGDDTRLFPTFEVEPAAFLSTWGSHPRWLVERWLSRWTPAEVRDLVETANRRPGLFLVPLGVDVAEALRLLSEQGLAATPVGNGTECILMDPGTPPRAALAVVRSIVQDPAAHLVTRYADVPSGMKVADLCAAPGGKALALSTKAAFTLAADRSEVRMRLVRENAARTGLHLGSFVADARHPPLAGVDAVLLDVPCSGTGTLGRHPDGRWRLGQESMGEMIDLQRDILDAGASLVPPGGVLVYATCTLEPEENQDQVAAFLSRRPDFRIEATDAVPADYRDERGHLVVLPQRHGFDGAFAARLRRAS
jgi:16S rRNA (cytosine967-C5)-methyltransferase